jgi:hypothetical protein
MSNLNLAYPTVSEEQKQALLVAKEKLEREDGGPKNKTVVKADENATGDPEAPAANNAATMEEIKKSNRKKGKNNK